MADTLEKVIDIAKKLRRAAKKVADPTFQSLITDLSLSLADLKVQMVEQRAGVHGQAQTEKASELPSWEATLAPDPAPVTAQAAPARDAGFGVSRGFPS